MQEERDSSTKGAKLRRIASSRATRGDIEGCDSLAILEPTRLELYCSTSERWERVGLKSRRALLRLCRRVAAYFVISEG